MNAKIFAMIGTATMLMASGVNAEETQSKWDYTNFKASKPTTILVVMPVSKEKNKAVASACLASAVLPLADAGYYPIPVTLANDTLQAIVPMNAEKIRQIPVQKLAKNFGADAVMYIDIEKFSQDKGVTSVVTEMTTYAKLVDMKTGTVLWENRAETSDDSSAAKTPLGYTPYGFVLRKLGGMVTTASSDKDYIFPTAQKNADALYATSGEGNPLLFGPKTGK